MNEREIIRRFFAGLATGPGVELGPGDDAAIVVGPGRLALSTDILVEEVHFAAAADPYLLGRKALAVNLSDLAAMGAKPLWALLGLSLPRPDQAWLEAFAAGFASMAREHAVNLIGGDLTRARCCFISVAVAGHCGRQVLCRSSAKAGDELWVSGQLGQAECELAQYGGLGAEPKHKQLNPSPRVDLGLALTGLARAAIDLSDGLLASAEQLAEASGLAALIDYGQVPVAPALSALGDPERIMATALNGGGDYELLFAASPAATAQIRRAAAAAKTAVSKIGTLRAGHGLELRNADQLLDPATLSVSRYEHFGPAAEEHQAVVRIADAAHARGCTVAVAESCTAGLVAAELASLPGASSWFAGGLTAYSARAKQALLGVPAELIETAGAVSEEVVLAMARGACARLASQWAVAVTGWAGPASAGQQAGLVWIGWVGPGVAAAQSCFFDGGRELVRRAASARALDFLAEGMSRIKKG